MDGKPVSDASAADDVIAELREGGEPHSEGHFTLDREVAREKLSEFQLPDPRWSLLLLVRAAVRRGASYLDVEVDANDIRLTFDGPPFDEDDFEHLYHDPLSDRAHEKSPGRSELALGLNVALALEPRYIRVHSGTGDAGAELELRPGKPDQYGPWSEPEGGTTIAVKLRKGLVVRAMANYGHVLPEVALLSERCQYADIPITVNGERVSVGLELGDAVACVDILQEGIAGAAGFSLDVHEPPGVRVVKHGVWIADLEPEPTPRELGVVVRANGIRTDLTQFGLVEDKAHGALLIAVDEGWRAAVKQVIALHEELRVDDQADVPVTQDWCVRTLRQALRRFDDEGHYQGRTSDPLAHRLCRLALWQTLLTEINNGGPQPLSWLQKKVELGKRIAYVHRDALDTSNVQLNNFVPNLRNICVLTESDGDAELLEKLLGDGLVYITELEGGKRSMETLVQPGGRELDLKVSRIATGIVGGIIGIVVLIYAFVSAMSKEQDEATSTSSSTPAPLSPFTVMTPRNPLTPNEALGIIPPDAGTVDDLSKACNRGDGASCFYLAHRLKKAESDLLRRIYTGRFQLRQGCLLGHLASCAHLSVHENAQYRRECNDGDAEACYVLGLMYESGGFGMIKGPGSARSFHDTACKGGQKKACERLKKLKP